MSIEINNIKTVIAEIERNEKSNLKYFASILKQDCENLSYQDFVNNFLAKSKQLKSGQNLLKKGNDKLHKSIGIWNLPAVFTCPNCKDCMKDCYAWGPQYRYPSARISRFINLLIVMYYPKDFVNQVVRQIRKQSIKAVRIHEAGDFYSELYAGLWMVIARMVNRKGPGTKFYFYTKSGNADDLAEIKNVNKVESILPDGSINFGPKEYVEAKSAEFNIPICPVTDHQERTCGLDCVMCQDQKYMLFVQHSG
jgi:hypothetical protein